MVAAVRKTHTRTRYTRRPRLCTVWTAEERITGKYIGYHVEGGTAYILIQPDEGCEPRRVDCRDVVAVVEHVWGGKRHLGVDA